MLTGALLTSERYAALQRVEAAHVHLREALTVEASLYPMLFCTVSSEQREDTARQLAEAQRMSREANRAYLAAVQEVTEMCRLSDGVDQQLVRH
jgi:hypothetical protein